MIVLACQVSFEMIWSFWVALFSTPQDTASCSRAWVAWNYQSLWNWEEYPRVIRQFDQISPSRVPRILSFWIRLFFFPIAFRQYLRHSNELIVMYSLYVFINSFFVVLEDYHVFHLIFLLIFENFTIISEEFLKESFILIADHNILQLTYNCIEFFILFIVLAFILLCILLQNHSI